MRKLTISQYRSFRDKGQKLDVRQVSWDEVIETLSDSKQTPETFEEFMAADKDERLRIKDCGYFVGGRFDPPIRLKKNIKGRSLATLDLDHLSFCDVELIKETFGKYAYLIHSTHSHSEDEPRLRLVIPLSRDVTPLEYEPLCRMIAKRMGMEYFDDSTYQSFRVMFLPSHAVDGDVVFEVNEGQWLDPSKVLDVYEDWGDFVEWPRSSREEKKGIREAVSEAGDPFEKPGYIGAFNRAYPIDEAIETFELPYEESGTGDNRYSYMGGESADGAVLYPEQGYLFSHHATDPANGNNCAWDLVRLHKFGSLDTEDDRKLPIAKQPSQVAMTDFAKTQDRVLEQAMEQPEVYAEDEFEDVVDSDTGEKVKVKKDKITYETIRTEVSDILAEATKLTPKQHEKLVMKAAAAELTETEVSSVAACLADRKHSAYNGASRASVLRDIKSKRKAVSARDTDSEEIKDIQVAFIDNFLGAYYNGGKHLRRTGKQFWAYNETHWERVSDEYVSGQLFSSLVELRVGSSKKERRALEAAVRENQTSAIWSSLWRGFQALQCFETGPGADPLGLNRPFLPRMINCASGELHFNKEGQRQLRKHKPLSYCTSVVPVEYDTQTECPEWDRFCAMTFSKAKDPLGMRRHLEEFIGYTLDPAREQRAWALFFGRTGSGKTVIGQVLNSLLGQENVKNDSLSSFNGRNNHAFAALVGKMLLLDEDYDEGKVLPDGFMKKVSEPKIMDANPKSKDEYSFVCRAMPVVMSNNPPPTRDTSGALYTRALIFPLKNSLTPAEKDPTRMRAMIQNELPGIFLRAVQGLGRLYARSTWDFPVDCTLAWEKWIGDSNPLPLFLSTCYRFTGDSGDRVSGVELFANYKAFMGEEHGGDAHSKGLLRRNRFLGKVDDIWGDRGHTSSGDCWKGFTFISGSLGAEMSVRDDEFDDVEEWDT